MNGHEKASIIVLSLAFVFVLSALLSIQHYYKAQEQIRAATILEVIKAGHSPLAARCMMDPMWNGQLPEICRNFSGK